MVSKLSFWLHLQQVIAQLGELHVVWAVMAPALCNAPPAACGLGDPVSAVPTSVQLTCGCGGAGIKVRDGGSKCLE